MAKADARKQTEWRKRLERFQSSGLTIAQFCRNENIPTHTFYYWGRRLGRPSRKSRPSALSRGALKPTIDGRFKIGQFQVDVVN